MKKILSKLPKLKLLLDKVYYDSIIISNNKDIYFESTFIINKLQNMSKLLSNMDNLHEGYSNIIESVSKQITSIKDRTLIDVYSIWDIQNKLDMLLIKNNGIIK